MIEYEMRIKNLESENIPDTENLFFRSKKILLFLLICYTGT